MYLRMICLCLGVSLSAPVVPLYLVVLEGICLSVLICLLTPDCGSECDCPSVTVCLCLCVSVFQRVVVSALFVPVRLYVP